MKWDTDSFIQKSKEIHGGDVYNYSHVQYQSTKIRVRLICNVCQNDFMVYPMNHLKGSKCKICADKLRYMNNTKSFDNFIYEAKLVHGEKFNYEFVVYKNRTSKIKLVCNDCGYDFYVLAHNHLSGSSCKKCQYTKLPQNQSMSHFDFVTKSNNIYGGEVEILSPYINAHGNVKIKFRKCGHIQYRRASQHISKYYGCKTCSIKLNPQNSAKPLTKFISQAITTHGNRYNYDLVDYKTCRDNVIIKCNTCSYIFNQNPTKHIKGYGCPSCSFSKGETKIQQCLDILGVEYICQYSFDKCVNPNTNWKLRFDFYIPKYNMVIEYDGIQHYIPCSFGGSKPKLQMLEYVQHKDGIKNKFCLDNNIKLLRIPYFEYDNIEHIIEHIIEKEVL